MEKSREFQCPLHMAFIDFRKAYDSVNRNILRYIIQHIYSIPEKLVKIIRALYSDTRASVRAYGKKSPEFAVYTGFRQGYVIYNIFFDVITKLSLQNHQQKGLPLLYHLGEQKLVGGWKKFANEFLLNNTVYVNDMVLLADSKSDLEEMLRSFDSTCSSMGLTVSTAKTKVLAVLPSGQTEPAIPLSLNPGEGNVLVVDTFAYLSCPVEKNCSIDAEVNSRIEKALRAFSSLSRVLWYHKRIRTSTKLYLLKAVILPVLTYGLESAVLLSHQVQCLQAFNNRYLCIILGISLQKERRNTSIRAQMQQEGIDNTLMRRRLCFLGHLARMDDHHLPKQLLLCTQS